MKIIKIILSLMAVITYNNLRAFQFVSAFKQQVTQHTAWKQLADRATVYAPQVQKFAGYADKAIAAGLITSSLISTKKGFDIQTEPLHIDFSEQTHNMTEYLCHKMDVNFSDIELLQISKNNKMATLGTSAAAYNGVFGKNKVFFYEGFFKRPLYQQKAILGHELIHIKNRDSLTQQALFAVIAAASIGTFRGAHYILTKLGQSSALKSYIASPLKSITIPLVTAFHPSFKGTGTEYDYDEEGNLIKTTVDDGEKTAGIGLRLVSTYARFCEKRADIDSAKLAGTAQGNIDALQDHVSTYDSYTTALAHHPCPEERIDYLKPYI